VEDFGAIVGMCKLKFRLLYFTLRCEIQGLKRLELVQQRTLATQVAHRLLQTMNFILYCLQIH